MIPIVRDAEIQDANAIAEFQILMAKETENKELDSATVLEAVQSVFHDTGKGFYLVAEADGKVVGSLMITFEWSDWRNCNLWYIQSVFVESEHRGQGIFKALYQEVIARATAEKVMFVRLYVETENERAQKVYESLGMKRMPYFMYDFRVT